MRVLQPSPSFVEVEGEKGVGCTWARLERKSTECYCASKKDARKRRCQAAEPQPERAEAHRSPNHATSQAGETRIQAWPSE